MRGTLQEFFKKHRREVPSAAHAPTGSDRCGAPYTLPDISNGVVGSYCPKVAQGKDLPFAVREDPFRWQPANVSNGRLRQLGWPAEHRRWEADYCSEWRISSNGVWISARMADQSRRTKAANAEWCDSAMFARVRNACAQPVNRQKTSRGSGVSKAPGHHSNIGPVLRGAACDGLSVLM